MKFTRRVTGHFVTHTEGDMYLIERNRENIKPLIVRYANA